MFQRLTIREGRHNCWSYVCHRERMFGPFDTAEKASEAMSSAAAEVAVEYAGLDCTAAEARDESFGTNDPEERDHRGDRYYNAQLNLLEGAEDSIVEKLLEANEDIEEHWNWQCNTCDYEWTGTNEECENCATACTDGRAIE